MHIRERVYRVLVERDLSEEEDKEKVLYEVSNCVLIAMRLQANSILEEI